MKDNEITNKVIDDLHQLKIIDKTKVCFMEVKRIKYAYIINDLDYHENIRIVKEYMREMGIDLVERSSEFKYLNMDECIRSAINYLMKK